MDEERWRKKVNGYFIGFCRRVFRWSPAYKMALKEAEKDSRYLCQNCRRYVKRDNKQIDHTDPVIPVKETWTGSWDWYRDRMRLLQSDSTGLAVLCTICHKKKTKKENEERRKWKKINAENVESTSSSKPKQG